jgi:hypothetical protein
MPPKKMKAHRPEVSPVLAELTTVSALTSTKDLIGALASLRSAAAAFRGLDASHRGAIISAFSSNLLAALLYACSTSGQPAVLADARLTFFDLFQPALDSTSADETEPATALSIDERVGTLALRVLRQAGEPRDGLLRVLRSMLRVLDKPGGGPKRRLYSPLLDTCAVEGDTDLALGVLREARARGISLRDSDFERCLTAADCAVQLGILDPPRAARVAADTVRLAVSSQPIVGGNVAALLQKLLPGAKVLEHKGPILCGKCAQCDGRFGKFLFTDEERAELLDGLVDRLIKPTCERRAATHTTDSSAAAAFDNFLRLKSHIDSLPHVSAVIDGANVGFFGLSSWYGDAKRNVLTAQGVNVAAMPEETFESSTLKKVGAHTDVPPNFAVIDAAVREFAARREQLGEVEGYPLIFLHERHLRPEALAGPNGQFRRQWEAQGVPVIITPNHVNDDLCWMYAALRHRCPVISNDQMRDHHFGLLAPQGFLKWRMTNQLRFTCRFDNAHVSLRFRSRPLCVTWPSIVDAPLDTTDPNGHGVPPGIHVPFTRKTLLEDTGKLLPGTKLPPNTLLVPQAPADMVDQASEWCEAWICAPVPPPA